MSQETLSQTAEPVPKRRFWSGIRDRIKSLGRTRTSPPPQEVIQEPIMPERLRYAMRYGEAKLEKREIGILINNNYTDMATYTLLKALDDQPATQQQFLESFVDVILSNPEDESKRKDLLKKLQNDTLEAQIQPSTPPIKGAKIAQIFRQGVHLWEGKFADLAQEVADTDQDTIPVYLGYGAALGLRQGIEKLKDPGRRILTFNAGWAEDPNSSNCGYEIDLQRELGERVRPLPKDFTRPKDYILIDDTQNTGSHIKNAWSFWSNNSGEPLPGHRLRILDHAGKQ